MEAIVSFGHWVKLRRQALRLTQSMLASRAYCSNELIRKIEADSRRPSPVVAERLAESLGLTPQQRVTFVKVARSEVRVDCLPPPTQVPPWPVPAVPVMQPNSLPVPATPLIGRATELEDLGAMLKNPSARLITIVGPGGIGKTRLALAAAAEQATAIRHGAAFVSLQGFSSAAFLATAILTGLDVELQGQRDPREQVLAYLREKELLLVLDNFEQLLAPYGSEDDGGTAILTDILQHVPGVTLLVTSRERLALDGEWLFDVSGLSYPLDELAEDLENYSAVQLFVQRANQVRRQFVLADGEARAVARICRLVEGLPLAIELAAAALRSRSCSAIAAAIETSMRVLAAELRAVPARHRSMWATFEHSWRLLSDEERKVFPRLSVFRGGFEEEAAARVANASPRLLAALVDKSLLRWDGLAHYDMHELLRQYAGEKLEQGETATETRKRLAIYFLELAQTIEPKLHGPEQATWLTRLEAEHDNLRAALGWSLGPAGNAEIGLRLAATLGEFWFAYGHLSEGRAWLASALTQPDTATLSEARAKALGWAGWMALFQGDGGVADAYYDEALALSRALGDRHGTAVRLVDLGLIAMSRGEYAHAAMLYQESLALFRALGDQYGSADVLMFVAATARYQGDYARAMMLFEESLALWRELENNVGMADVLDGMGRVKFNQGDYVQAATLYQEALALARQARHHHLSAMVRSNLGRVIHVQGDHWQGLALIEESVAWFRDVGHKSGLAWALLQLSAVIYTQGDDVRARGILREALVLQQEQNLRGMIAESLERFAGFAMRQRQPEQAARLFGVAEALRETIGAPLSPVDRAEYEANVSDVRAQLNDTTFAIAWAKGRAMTLEQAIAYAFGEYE